MENIKITEQEIQMIRSLSDFDLTMLLSEVNDHGWDAARVLLPAMTYK
mgnify:CR=1 FL=1